MDLNQLLGIERALKTTATKRITETHKSNQKPTLFDGTSSTYRMTEEGGTQHPPKGHKVQITTTDAIDILDEEFSRLISVTAQKDIANCEAFADVVVDGKVLLANVPAAHLIWLERRLRETVRTFIAELPTLDPAYNWVLDANDNLFKADGGEIVSTKKSQKPIVLYPATPEHPAQTQLIVEDEVVGFWRTFKHSGAMRATLKQQYLKRVDALLEAVALARSKANQVEVAPSDIGAKVFEFILGD